MAEEKDLGEQSQQAVQQTKGLVNTTWGITKKVAVSAGVLALSCGAAEAAIAANKGATILSAGWHAITNTGGNILGGLDDVGQVIANTATSTSEAVQWISDKFSAAANTEDKTGLLMDTFKNYASLGSETGTPEWATEVANDDLAPAWAPGLSAAA